MTRAALALLLALSLPARAAEPCPPGDDACELAEAVIRLDAELVTSEARAASLARQLAACERTRDACPPRVEPAPVWPLLVAAGGVGVAAGALLVAIVGR